MWTTLRAPTRYVGRAAKWVAAQELIVLASALLAVGSVWGFVVLADEVHEGDTQSFDERILKALRRPDDPGKPIGPEWLHDAAVDITALGGTTVITLMIGAIAGFLLLRRRHHAMWLVLTATAGGALLNTALKLMFSRDRPSIVPQLDIVRTHSFPSGHSMLSAVVYLTLGALLIRMVDRLRLKAYILGVAMLAALLIGLSRVYLGVHYPTDVLAGWTLGLAWALLCWIVARYLQKRGAVEPPAPATPLPGELSES